MRRRLLVWDGAWAPYADLFSELLPQWEVASNSGDVEWLRANVGGADALLATTLPAEILPHARSVRVVLYPGAGVHDTNPRSYPAGCQVVNVYEHEGAIAEYVIMTMLLHETGLLSALDNFRAGDWSGSGRLGGPPHGELHGRTVGFFGNGHIARAVVQRAEVFGMRTVAASRNSGVPLEAMLPQLDYLVIAAPLTEQSRGRIGRAELTLLPRHAYLINVARAEIVCERALYDALESRSIAGAALDVWYTYPKPGERGYGSSLPFHELPNAICTPHYSAWTLPMIRRRIAAMAANLRRLDAGQPLERVVLKGEWR
jgi:phosphoglycerate dehydrogenase-like enzyme